MFGQGDEISATSTDVEIAQGHEIEDMGVAYKRASTKDWKGFKKFYEDLIKEEHNTEVLFTHLTVNEDNAFHKAASSEAEHLLEELLAMLPDSDKHKAFTSKDVHKNTPLHEVATTNCVEAAKLILSGTHNQQDEILKMRNVLGETALYRAAAFGQTRMVRYLAEAIEKVGSFLCHDPLENLRYHFRRKDGDSMSILHMAVLGQHFDTAVWLLKKDKELAQKRENNNMTSLQLLALMPTAFYSTNLMGVLETMAYHCLPIFSDDEEDDDYENNDHECRDLETGKNHSACRCQQKKHNGNG